MPPWCVRRIVARRWGIPPSRLGAEPEAEILAEWCHGPPGEGEAEWLRWLAGR